MATRFYLPMGGTAPSITPAVGTSWDVTPTGFGRGVTDTAKSQNTTITAETSTNFGETSANPVNVIHRQWISAALSAQTISGTFSAVIRGGEDAATNDAALQVVLRVVSSDGLTERGVLYAGESAALNTTSGALGQEWATSSQTRIIPSGTALTSVTTQSGDRLVIEIGHRHYNTLTTNATGWLTYGDTTATADFALTAGLTTVLNPWVELSGAVTFGGGTPVALTGAVAAVTLAAPAGTVSTQTNAALTGAVGVVTVSAPAGSVATQANVTLTGAVGSVTIGAPAGTVATQGAVALTGAVSSASVAAPAGTVTTTTNVALTTTPATMSVAAPTGTVAVGGSISLSGPVASVTLSSPSGTVSTQRNVALSGPVAATTLAALAGTVATQQLVTLTGAASSLSFAAPAGVVLIAANAAPTPASRTTTVSPDSRLLTVGADTRTVAVTPDARLLAVPADVRVLSVPADNRTVGA